MTVRRELQAQVVCAICDVALQTHDVYVDGALISSSYEHPLNVDIDHSPIPVVAADGGQGGKGVCDFCSQPAPEWGYPANDFISGGVETDVEFQLHAWDGAWTACGFCAALIDTEDRDGLQERVVAILSSIRGPLLPITQFQIHALHALFFENRTGPREKIR